MKHIETPVSVAVEHTTWPPIYCTRVIDDRGTIIFYGSRHYTSKEALADPLANELARAINAHDALVEALEKARHRIWHTASCPWGISGRMCSCGASGIKQGIEDALALAKGETE